jgi:hypothetical protein
VLSAFRSHPFARFISARFFMDNLNSFLTVITAHTTLLRSSLGESTGSESENNAEKINYKVIGQDFCRADGDDKKWRRMKKSGGSCENFVQAANVTG